MHVVGLLPLYICLLALTDPVLSVSPLAYSIYLSNLAAPRHLLTTDGSLFIACGPHAIICRAQHQFILGAD